MVSRQEFDRCARVIEAHVRTLESSGDPALRACARELVQALMELHGAGLERMLTITSEAGDQGAIAVNRCAEDHIVKPLLVLHGLHPLGLEQRVLQGVTAARRRLGKDVEAIDLVLLDDSGVALIRVVPGTHRGDGWSTATRTSIENAVLEAAPDVTEVRIELPEDEPAVAFVPLGNLRRTSRERQGLGVKPDGSAVLS